MPSLRAGPSCRTFFYGRWLAGFCTAFSALQVALEVKPRAAGDGCDDQTLDLPCSNCTFRSCTSMPSLCLEVFIACLSAVVLYSLLQFLSILKSDGICFRIGNRISECPRATKSPTLNCSHHRRPGPRRQRLSQMSENIPAL